MLQVQADHAALRKMAQALEHKARVENIRHCHEELLEAEIQLIEARSDVEALQERNSEIVQMLAQEEELVRAAEAEAKAAHETATRAIKVCKAIQAECTVEESEHFTAIPDETRVEDLEMEIAAEEAKLDYIHASNPNAIRDFEKRKAEIEKLKDKLTDDQAKLERYGSQITRIRGQWEPELDKLIEEISDAFSYNFEQIGCAGQVGIHKDEDFDQWAIEIKVKFRYARSPPTAPAL